MIRSNITLALTVLVGLALTTAARAQFGGGVTIGMPPPIGGPPLPGSGMPMGGPPLPGNRPPDTRMPFAAGKIIAVHAAAGTVTLLPMFGPMSGGAGAQTVQITDTTQITVQSKVLVSDLKVGDTVQVHGVPTSITATQITAGDNFDSPLGGMMGNGPRPGGMAGGPRPGPEGPSADFAQVSGKITSLTPLTISLSNSIQVTLKVTATTLIHKTVTEKIGDLKAGDRILANGQTGDDGVFHATRLRVTSSEPSVKQ
jgi:hypothetical protein